MNCPLNKHNLRGSQSSNHLQILRFCHIIGQWPSLNQVKGPLCMLCHGFTRYAMVLNGNDYLWVAPVIKGLSSQFIYCNYQWSNQVNCLYYGGDIMILQWYLKVATGDQITPVNHNFTIKGAKFTNKSSLAKLSTWFISSTIIFVLKQKSIKKRVINIEMHSNYRIFLQIG